MKIQVLVLSLVLGLELLAGTLPGSPLLRQGQGAHQSVFSQVLLDSLSDVQRLVVISAMPDELQRLLSAARIERAVEIAGRTHHVGHLEGHPVVLMLAGVSMVNAAASTQAVIDHFDIGAVVVSGIAGGVSPDLAIGDVVVPAQWGQYQEMIFARETADGWDVDGRAGRFENFGMMFPRGQLVMREGTRAQEQRRQFWFPVDEDMLAVAGEIAADIQLARCLPNGQCLENQPSVIVGGNGVSGPTFVDNAEFREWTWRAFSAWAVDMETAAIGQVAASNGVPFLGFRSLSDLAGGNDGGNQIRVFSNLAADNSADVLLGFLRAWRGPN